LFYSKPQINFFRSIWNFWRKLLGIIFQQMKFPLFSPNEFILKRSRFWPTGYSFINFCTFFYFIDTRWQNKPWRMLFGNQFSKVFLIRNVIRRDCKKIECIFQSNYLRNVFRLGP
jgi:hypothetical protein